MTGQRFKSVWDALPSEVRPKTCQTCVNRLDVTLWGLWLATGCRMGLVLRRGCSEWALIQLDKAKEVQA